MSIPANWMPDAAMSRVHIHWTGGKYTANATDKSRYHILIEGDGSLVRGDHPINANAKGSGIEPASHTRKANTGAIGVSICSMFGSREAPFLAGNFPVLAVQWDQMIGVVAELSRHYEMPVTPKTILTHAEVQTSLGIPQKNKWDIVRLVFDPATVGHKAVGDKLRHEVAVALDKLSPPGTTPTADILKLARFRVVGVSPSTLNLRNAPAGQKKGELPEGTLVERLGEDGGWWRIRTPQGFAGWVWGDFLQPA